MLVVVVNMQTLKLADEFFPSLTNGNKRVTIRAGKRDIEIGPLLFKGDTDTTIQQQVEVERIAYTKCKYLTDDDAWMDDADSVPALLRTLSRFYPGMGHEDLVTIIYFS